MNRSVGFILMTLVWGLTWLPMKLAAEAVPPIFLGAVRFLVAGLVFLCVALVLRLPLRPVRPGRVVLATLLITTLCYTFVFWGVAHAPSGLSAILNLSLLPIFVMGIGAAYGQERLTARRIGAIALGIAGLVLLFSTRTAGAGERAADALPGLAAVALGTLFFAWGAVVSRPLVGEMPPVSLACWQTLLGGLTLVPVSLAVEGYAPGQLGRLLDPRALLGLGVLVLGGSLTAFSIYLWLVREWGAFRAGLYCFLSPLVAVAVGVAWAGEPFTWPEATGMVLMLSATALAIRPPAGSAPEDGAVSASAARGSSPGRPG